MIRLLLYLCMAAAGCEQQTVTPKFDTWEACDREADRFLHDVNVMRAHGHPELFGATICTRAPEKER